jgi:hypothetical protein
MSIFDVDYINVVWQLLVPPDKRLPKWLAWGASVMQGKQWWHNAVFTTYAGGDSVDLAYNPTIAYTTGQRVIYYVQSDSSAYTGANAYYGDNAVYEAIYPVSAGTAPTGNNVVPDVPPAWVINSTSALTWLNTGNGGNPFYWIKVSDNFIGANERVSYSAQKLIFEYALNRWFNTTFRQPVIGTSDIYINRNSSTTNQFFWGQPPPAGTINSFFGPSTNTTVSTSIPLSKFFTPGNSFLLLNDFSINIPIAVYNALYNETPVTAGSNTANRDAVVSNFANLLNPAGSSYNIITY